MPEKECQVSFGVFEFDKQSRELRKHGIRIKLEDQPFEILAALLEKAGEVVTRSELKARLWPEGTFVDFDKSLTKAINKIRTALGDSATTPRFIETLSRRGYRFIAPLRPVNGSHTTSAPNSRPERVDDAKVPARRLSSIRLILSITVVFVTLLTVAVGLNIDRLRARFTVSASRIESLAVLPLKNLTGDSTREYFTDGLTDELISALSRISSLRVISRTSAMRYKGLEKPLPEIARALNVNGIVEGTVRRSGNVIRINVTLFQAPQERQLWAADYERDMSEADRLPQQVALAIAHEVSGQLALVDRTRLNGKHTVKPSAYDAYLRGRYLWNQRKPVEVAEAVTYFEQALREDPDFALAWSGLSDCYSTGWGVKRNYPRAEELARKALALEPDLAEAYASLGVLCDRSYRFSEAEKELKRAIELNPNCSMAHHSYAVLLLHFGRLTEALAENDRALQLDPFSMALNAFRLFMFQHLQQYDRAIEQARLVAAMEPASPVSHIVLGRVYWTIGQVPDALAEERQAAVLEHDPVRIAGLDEVASVYAKSGPAAAKLRWAQIWESESITPDFDLRVRANEATNLPIAIAYATAGDRKKTLAWLERAVRDQDDDLLEELKSAPEFEFVRTDPRFQDLFRRVGLPQ